jgi:hypothetical protein
MYLIFVGFIGFVLFADRFGNKDRLKAGFLTLNINAGFIVIFAYLIVTGYMQFLAIRYNATVSIPLAIFAALGLYTVWALTKDRMIENLAVPSAVVCACIGLGVLYLAATSLGTPPGLTVLLGAVELSTAALVYAVVRGFYEAGKNNPNKFWMALLGQVDYANIAYAAIAVLVLLGVVWVTGNLNNAISMLNIFAGSAVLVVALIEFCIVYAAYASSKGSFKPMYVCAGFIMAMLVFNFYSSAIASVTASPADGVNNSFLSAMTWMSKNTPANSTVVAVWPDGSVVEAWGNRTSYTDSVGGENGTRITGFSQFLFNTSPDANYLYSTGRPDYIVARGFWYQELGGLAVEGMVQNSSSFGFVALGSLQVSRNATAQFYKFQATSPIYCIDAGGNQGGCDSNHPIPVYYKAMVVMSQQANNSSTNAVSAYIGTTASSGYEQIKYVMFYNEANYNYSILQSTVNAVSNYTLMVSYYNRTITGGAILGQGLPYSNLFRFTFLCNYNACPYGDNSVNMQTVFINNDTRILKVNYH